jgi:hypothetical protein
MKITIKIFKQLEDWWIDDDQAREMSDAEIVTLLQEDVLSMLDGATWEVVREAV